MLCATDALKPPKLRIGRIGGNVTLPRTVPVMSLVAGGIGGLVGLALIGAIFGYSIATIMYGALFGALSGIGMVTYSPLRGESLAKWFGLKLLSQRRQITIDGKPVRLAVGICYAPQPRTGTFRLRAGSVRVPVGAVDERGALLPVPDLWAARGR